ncbi:MAG: hypothetical protein Q8P61_04985 [Candidatus Nanopelagicales bacterium]|nr:hypothetical protein [Candidatus Nanopelagicales bacterium]
MRYTKDGTPLDLFLDLQGMDETGMPWGFLKDASDTSRIYEGAWITVGSSTVYAVARVIDIVTEETGDIVHVHPQPGPGQNWLHLLPATAAAS